MTAAVLSLNAGSSSLKFALWEAGAAGSPRLVARGQVEAIATAPRLIVRDAAGATLEDRRWPAGQALGHEAFLPMLFDWADRRLGTDTLVGVGHRIVHGGRRFAAPVRIDDAVLADLEALTPLAPLHQPHNVAVVRAAAQARPKAPQVACFDTAFHQSQPPVATRFALPRTFEAEGVRRYGFHGLSYEFVARRLAEVDPMVSGGRVIAAHLGNGASLCAMKSGTSLDTTMGFSAADGLVMGTRCGALDPGVILYLMQARGFGAAAIEDLIYRRSGLLGVSGLSGDMRTLLASGATAAKEAIELFVYRLAREAGALAGVLGGLDGLVFTAGIGENAPAIRAAVGERLAWLGVEIDPEANLANAAVISTSSSRVLVRIIPTDEERMIALHVLELLAGEARAAAPGNALGGNPEFKGRRERRTAGASVPDAAEARPS
jgi:acetate kinase